MSEEDRKRLLWLDALEAAGVDNWDGCSFAHEMYRERLAAEGLEED